jgi:hypothetical protein
MAAAPAPSASPAPRPSLESSGGSLASPWIIEVRPGTSGLESRYVDRSDPAQVANEPFNGMLQEKAKFLKRFLNHVREIERMEAAAQPFQLTGR